MTQKIYQEMSYIEKTHKSIQKLDGLQEQGGDKCKYLRLDSVEKFRNYIQNCSVLACQFNGALQSKKQQQPNPESKTQSNFMEKIDQLMDLLNVVIQTPPQFQAKELSGLPIYSIFHELMNNKFGTALFSRPDVNDYLKDILNDYAEMLKTEKSLKHLNSEEGGWLSQQALKYINYNDFVCDQNQPHFGFKCWNDWFTRELTEGARPIDGTNDPFVIVHSSENYHLTTATNVKSADKFWLKQNCYSLYNMFEVQTYGVKQIIDESFVGGTVYQGFLSPWCYHRWHSPVSGIIEKSYKIPGCYYFQNPYLDYSQQSNYVNSQVFLSCISTRHIFIINTQNESIGRVAIVQIGMGEVSSCVSTVKEGDRVTKGQCIGRFEFGGSSHAIVFDRKVNLTFNPLIYQTELNHGVQKSKIQKVNSWLARICL